MDNMKVEIFRRRISEVRGNDTEVVILTGFQEPDDLIIRDDLIYYIPDSKIYNKIIRIVKEYQLSSFFRTLSCPMDSNLTPKHEKMTNLSEIIMYKNKEFPRIRFDDPVVKWNNWKCDSFIRITRDDGKIYYRHLYCSEDCHHTGDYSF